MKAWYIGRERLGSRQCESDEGPNRRLVDIQHFHNRDGKLGSGSDLVPRKEHSSASKGPTVRIKSTDRCRSRDVTSTHQTEVWAQLGYTGRREILIWSFYGLTLPVMD